VIGGAHVSWRLIVLASALALATASAPAAEEPYTLRQGTWVCSTPDAYDLAISAQARSDDLEALKARLLEHKLCMIVDDDDLEDLMAPFVVVLERSNDKVKVTFEIEFYKRIAFLHRSFSRVRFAGWTHESRLVGLYR
jgi:hypothetical protein